MVPTDEGLLGQWSAEFRLLRSVLVGQQGVWLFWVVDQLGIGLVNYLYR